MSPSIPLAAFQWELLEEQIKKKLKDPEIVELVLEKVKCILKIPGKVSDIIVVVASVVYWLRV